MAFSYYTCFCSEQLNNDNNDNVFSDVDIHSAGYTSLCSVWHTHILPKYDVTCTSELYKLDRLFIT